MKTAQIAVSYIDHMGTDLSVVNAARVSFDKESEWVPPNTSSGYTLSHADAKLISYLAKHNHWSPFAHTSIQLRVKAPIFVARQLVKHQVGGVWNEVSRRYVSDAPEFYFPEVWRGKPVNAKQGSDGEIKGQSLCHSEVAYTTESALEAYAALLDSGVAPEQARMVLPQNTMTEWIWTGSLVFWARVCKLRLDAHAQAETAVVAQQINALVGPQFPVSWKALMV